MVGPARLFVLPALVLFATAAFAQSPSSYPITAGVIPSEWMSASSQTAETASDSPPAWHADLLLGFPLGVRIQRNVGESPWLCEGFVGLAGISPTVGAGVRRQFVVVQGASNALLINPGVDGYLGLVVDLSGVGNAMGGGQGNSGPAGYLAGDVDLIWVHEPGRGCETRLGVKLGAGVGRLGVLPVASLFFGWGF